MSDLSSPSIAGSARFLAADIKLAHSVFALPFALLGAFMAAAGHDRSIDWPRLAAQLGLVVLAMVLARTAAMLANRLLDRHIDRLNPRTASRAIASGRVSAGAALGVLLAIAVVFLVVCGAFGVLFGNWWPAALGAPVLLWTCAYPLCKRFTALSHVWLGSSLALSPLAAALAIEPRALLEQPAIWLISGMVLCWVAGFDIIYALQDLDVDRSQGLHSIPGRLGVRGAIRTSRLLHALAAGLLVGAALAGPRFGVLFALGAALTACLLVVEHATVRRWGTSRIALSVFTLNGLISCLLGALGIADVLA